MIYLAITNFFAFCSNVEKYWHLGSYIHESENLMLLLYRGISMDSSSVDAIKQGNEPLNFNSLFQSLIRCFALCNCNYLGSLCFYFFYLLLLRFCYFYPVYKFSPMIQQHWPPPHPWRDVGMYLVNRSVNLLHDEPGVGDGKAVEQVHEDHHDEKDEHQQEGEGQPGCSTWTSSRGLDIRN